MSPLFHLTLLVMATGLCKLPRGEEVLWNEVLNSIEKLAPQIDIQSSELMLVLPSKLFIAEGLDFEPASN